MKHNCSCGKLALVDLAMIISSRAVSFKLSDGIPKQEAVPAHVMMYNTISRASNRRAKQSRLSRMANKLTHFSLMETDESLQIKKHAHKHNTESSLYLQVHMPFTQYVAELFTDLQARAGR